MPRFVVVLAANFSESMHPRPLQKVTRHTAHLTAPCTAQPTHNKAATANAAPAKQASLRHHASDVAHLFFLCVRLGNLLSIYRKARDLPPSESSLFSSHP